MIQHSFNAETRTLRVKRPYDNAQIELVVPEGTVRANGRVIGTIPSGSKEQPAEGWLTPNAIAILSGAVATKTAAGWAFNLDERLRPDANLQLWLNGKRLTPTVPPKAVGTMLLVPLRPIADALGSKILVEGKLISIVRIQDGVTVSWNSVSDLITLNKKPIGIVAGSALVDLSALLLPRDAVAALTGTNIKLMPGSNRVEAELDDRLAEVATPTADALDRARNAPAELERVSFQLGTAGTNMLNVRGHSGLHNGQLRLEAPASGAWLGHYDAGRQQVDNPFRPNWASLEWQSLLGVSGIVGDGVAGRRELDGINVSRWRGAGLHFPLGTGSPGSSLRFIAGEMLANANAPISNANGPYYPRFGGSVFGARWYGADGANEAGLSRKRDSNALEGQLTTLSWTHQTRGQGFGVVGTGPIFYSDLHIGHLDRELGGWGGRGLLSVSKNIAGTWNATGTANYTSGTFNGTLIRDAVGNLKRAADMGGLDFTLGGPVGANTQFGGRLFSRRTGIEDTEEARSNGGGLSWSQYWSLFEFSSNLDFSTAKADTSLNQTSVHNEADRITLTLDKRWNETLWSARLEDVKSRGAMKQHLRTATIAASASPWLWLGNKNQSLSVTPSGGLAWNRSDSRGATGTSFGRNLAVNMAYQSGALLGESWRLALNAGWSGSQNSSHNERVQTQLSDLLSGNITQARTDQTSTSSGWYFNLRSQHRLSRHFAFEWGGNKAQGGDAYLYLQLNGAFDFSPAQIKSLPKAGRGVLEGMLFFDENANGIQDAGERGIAQTTIRLQNTPWALRSSGSGSFTINNLPQGQYQVDIDLASLPQGYRVADGARLRFSVLDQRVTEIKIPIIEVGQVRGRVFVDKNSNDTLDDVEDGVVGSTLTLSGENFSASTRSTIFGQFVFDLVPAGRYTLKTGNRERKIEITTKQKFVIQDMAVSE